MVASNGFLSSHAGTLLRVVASWVTPDMLIAELDVAASAAEEQAEAVADSETSLRLTDSASTIRHSSKVAHLFKNNAAKEFGRGVRPSLEQTKDLAARCSVYREAVESGGEAVWCRAWHAVVWYSSGQAKWNMGPKLPVDRCSGCEIPTPVHAQGYTSAANRENTQRRDMFLIETCPLVGHPRIESLNNNKA